MFFRTFENIIFVLNQNMKTYILSNLYYNARSVLNKVLFSVPLIFTNKQELYTVGTTVDLTWRFLLQ